MRASCAGTDGFVSEKRPRSSFQLISLPQTAFLPPAVLMRTFFLSRTRACACAHTTHTQPPSYLACACILLIVLSYCFSHYLQVFLSNTQSCKNLQKHRKRARKKYINFPLKFGLFIYLTHPTILSRTHTFPFSLLDCDLQAR